MSGRRPRHLLDGGAFRTLAVLVRKGTGMTTLFNGQASFIATAGVTSESASGSAMIWKQKDTKKTRRHARTAERFFFPCILRATACCEKMVDGEV